MTQKSSKRKAADQTVDSPKDEVAAKARQHCILLVEDEALIAEVIAEALTDSGYAVHTAATAQEAMTHLSNAQVDLLFTDINLPGEIDGVELAAQVRAVHPKLPVVFASGRWWRLDDLKSLPNAATLPKPYSPARACEAVEALLAESAAAADDREQEAQAALAL
jgi:DNA-binding response OmpR family regulator